MSALPDPVLRQAFLDGMSHTACTVNVVTTDGAAGRAGVTVSAMSSVSADGARPTLLVCVHHLSPTAAKIVENGVFCVNVLQDHQAYISDTFAGRRDTDDGDKFSCTHWTTEKTGAPRVIDPLAAFDCRVVSGERVGTHHVFIGEVEAIFSANQGAPLVFANRAYGSTARIQTVSPSGEGLKANLALRCFHTFGPFLLPGLIARIQRSAPSITLSVVEG
ncbi:MAG: flavin reductase, partial [Geminicoccaceae bacterium]